MRAWARRRSNCAARSRRSGNPPLLVERWDGNPHRHERVHVSAGHPGTGYRRCSKIDGLFASEEMREKVAVHTITGQQWNEFGGTSAGESRRGDFVQIRAELCIEHVALVETICGAPLTADAGVGARVQDASTAADIFDTYERKLRGECVLWPKPLAIHLAKFAQLREPRTHSATAPRTDSASASISSSICCSMALSSSRISRGSRWTTEARFWCRWRPALRLKSAARIASASANHHFSGQLAAGSRSCQADQRALQSWNAAMRSGTSSSSIGGIVVGVELEAVVVGVEEHYAFGGATLVEDED